MKALKRLVRFILVLAVLLIVGYLAVKEFKPDLLELVPGLGSNQPVSDLMEVPDGFEAQADYTVEAGTDVSGVGTVEDGFTFVGVERVEFVLGYTLEIPSATAEEGLDPEKAAMILDTVLLALKAVGFNDSSVLQGMQSIGEESVGITFTTTWKDNLVRVDAIIFRKGVTGAIAAVGYIDGQHPSVSVAEVASNLDEKIQ